MKCLNCNKNFKKEDMILLIEDLKEYRCQNCEDEFQADAESNSEFWNHEFDKK